MRKKITYYIGVLFLFILAGTLMNTKPCLAASAQVEISSDVSEVTVGDNVFVYITIDSEKEFGDFEANLTYDDDLLEYQSSSTVVTGSSGFLKLSDINVTEGSTTRKYVLKFEALKAGICNISFSRKVMVSDYETGTEMSVSSNVLSLKVLAPRTASENANLKSLKISPAVLDPAFDKKVFQYNVTVGYNIDKLVVDALPEDSKATVSITGNDFLKEGENKVIVTVLAESGAIIEYTINVTREASPQTTPEVTVIPEPTSGLNVIQAEDGIYAILNGKYKLIQAGSDVTIPDGYTKITIILSSLSIDAYAPEHDLDSEFPLIYARNEMGEEDFYQYDRIEKTLQRFHPSKMVNTDDTNTTDQEDLITSQEYQASLNKAAVSIAVLSALCVLFLVLLIVFFIKNRRR
jgi:hypothetical protein